MSNLNANELRVLKACADNALDVAGGDFGFGDEISGYVDDLNDKQIAGYLSQLSQKNLIDIEDFETLETEGTQITFPDGKEEGGLRVLLDAGLVDEAYVDQFHCWQ